MVGEPLDSRAVSGRIWLNDADGLMMRHQRHLIDTGQRAVKAALAAKAPVLGKLVGAGAPARMYLVIHGALLIGISMVPRAEIALLVAGYGLSLGAWAMTLKLYNAVVLTSLATCLLSPVVISWLLLAAPQSEPDNGP